MKGRSRWEGKVQDPKVMRIDTRTRRRRSFPSALMTGDVSQAELRQSERSWRRKERSEVRTNSLCDPRGRKTKDHTGF